MLNGICCSCRPSRWHKEIRYGTTIHWWAVTWWSVTSFFCSWSSPSVPSISWNAIGVSSVSFVRWTWFGIQHSVFVACSQKRFCMQNKSIILDTAVRDPLTLYPRSFSVVRTLFVSPLSISERLSLSLAPSTPSLSLSPTSCLSPSMSFFDGQRKCELNVYLRFMQIQCSTPRPYI